ncbi:MAG TPA: DNA recombination protein RmuC [Syntrophorhabdaceae bacterium]|jgi:DNA recombination protein RmuC
MITLTEIGALVLGLIAGSAVAWIWAASASRRSISESAAAAGSAEAVGQELRRRIEADEREKAALRVELTREQGARIEAATRLDAAEKSLEAEKRLLEGLKKEMSDTFNALSSRALKASSEDFIRVASLHLEKVIEIAKGNLGEHQAAMDGMIAPLKETLRRYEEELKAMEQGRLKAHGSLEEQLRALALSHESLQKETGNLVSALRRPEIRGRWGEMQLKRVAELSGMSAHCDFTEQCSIDTDKGRVRPDMVIHLPSDREIVVDSKVSLDAYLDAVADPTEESRAAKIVRHAQQVRAHMNRLSSKEYWSQFAKSPEFVILFIPGESFLGAALDKDPSLIEDGIQKGVIAATPTTFIALLRAIAFGWRQEQITKNAAEVSLLGKELYDRVSTMAKHFEDLGNHIRKTTDAYNKTVGSMEARILPSVRRFKDLGVTGAAEIPIIDQIDAMPRSTEGLKSENPEEGGNGE